MRRITKVPTHKRLQPTRFYEKWIKARIVNFIRSFYHTADQAIALRWIMQVIFDELQDSFPEDNIPTTIAFMVEETLNASTADINSTMYEKLKEIVGDK